jgi:5-methylthioadenosine/S-adenosylhomocysteine deaminase
MLLTIDTLISARWIIPVEPPGRVLEDHALAINEGRIVAILPKQEAFACYRAAVCVEGPCHVLMPGLVNTHTHAAMTLLRGLADDLPLMEWLSQHIWPAENRWVSEAFVHDGAQLAMAEMLRGGITCFNDMYFFPETVAAAVNACGMRACIGLIVIDFPSPWAKDADAYLRKGLALYPTLDKEPLLSAALAPHGPYTVNADALKQIRTLAEQWQIPIHMHVHETAAEVEGMVRQQGCRPLQWLDNLGLVSERLLAVHMTQLTDAEISWIARCGVHVIHCPESNLKLASGFCPVAKLDAAGVNVALGTDGTASNNDLNLLGEMRIAALLAKGLANDAAVLPAHRVLRMATLNGAKALGLDQQIGSLEPGKWADVTLVDLGAVETEPVYHPISQLVYATDRQQVTDVWVAGRPLLRNRELTTLDIEKIIHRARGWRDKIHL